MTYNEMKQLRVIFRQIQETEKQIQKEERRLRGQGRATARVLASTKEDPYIQTHITIEGEADTWPLRKLQAKRQFLIDDYNKLILEVEDQILQVKDTNLRQALYLTIVEGKSQVKASKEMGFTQSYVSVMINKYFPDGGEYKPCSEEEQ